MNNTQTARIVYYGIYHPHPDNIKIKHIIDNSDIVVVFDHGVHWNPKHVGEFRKDMTTLLSAYVDTNLTMVAWQQTSSQHNPTEEGGHWYPGANLDAGCQPRDDVDILGYHMHDIVNASNAVNLTLLNAMDSRFHEQPRSTNELIVLPYREYTRPLHYMHSSNLDCTHYCSTPYVWLPIWRSLRVGMERALS
eukprot:scaffold31161_cov56-Attheya_sp.AAC.5